MTNPCRSDCPAGDCAGCFGLQQRIVNRCVPADCEQRQRCARADVPSGLYGRDFDASGCKTPSGWCPMFIDKRGLALTPAQ